MDNRKIIHDGKVVNLGIETVILPNNETMELEVVRHPGGATVVAIDDKQRELVIDNHILWRNR